MVKKLKLVFYLEDENKQLFGEKKQTYIELPSGVEHLKTFAVKVEDARSNLPKETLTKGIAKGWRKEGSTEQEQVAAQAMFDFVRVRQPLNDICQATGILVTKSLLEMIIQECAAEKV